MILLKLILFFIVAYYVLGLVARLAMPYLLRTLLTKVATKAQQQQQQRQNQPDFAETDTNTHSSKSTHSHTVSNKHFKGGDYIEYEEG